ncbi:toxin co-regulated pilus biosynthesis Q family protein [Ralstonia thomasii]|uniref:toxin co-regulated pilus biosynthesis Q family protein n=1 Tax=Ralstonia thomasii TaxID=3058596 RepID=UPI003C30484F
MDKPTKGAAVEQSARAAQVAPADGAQSHVVASGPASPGLIVAAVPVIAPIVAASAQPAPAPAAMPVIAPMWQINKADGSLRNLFNRWGGLAGWTSQWEVDQEVPLVATDSFSGSFTDAVRAVLRTTEGTDLPIHPCFYTNNFLRVVPISTDCDPEQD